MLEYSLKSTGLDNNNQASQANTREWKMHKIYDNYRHNAKCERRNSHHESVDTSTKGTCFELKHKKVLNIQC